MPEGEGTRRTGDGVQPRTVWDEVLDTEHAVVVRTYVERWPRKDRPDEKVLIVVVEPDEDARCRCPRCGRRGRRVESEVRRWRTLDVHGKRCFLESDLPKIDCPEAEACCGAGRRPGAAAPAVLCSSTPMSGRAGPASRRSG